MAHDDIRVRINHLNTQPCKCVSCPECNGTGSIWVNLHGRYLGNRRCDDLDSPEPCEECRGGVVEVCERCQEIEELSDDEY